MASYEPIIGKSDTTSSNIDVINIQNIQLPRCVTCGKVREEDVPEHYPVASTHICYCGYAGLDPPERVLHDNLKKMGGWGLPIGERHLNNPSGKKPTGIYVRSHHEEDRKKKKLQRKARKRSKR